ncbi:MAG: tetratricopeptide repeat protein [Bacteroidia bacterium]|nr:tetratricopeptide repeat protein [Bacteroidia bacterium]
MRALVFLIPFFLFSVAITQAQTRKIDSLKQVLKTAKNDTAKVSLLNVLSYEIYLRTEKSTGEVALLIDSTIRMAERLKYVEGNIKARLIGSNVFRNTGKIQKSIEYIIPALELAQQAKDTINLFRIKNSLGSSYADEGNFKIAGQCFFEALQIAELLNSKKFISSAYNSLGNLYSSQQDHIKAISYYLKSLPMNVELKDKMRTSFSCVNLGKSYRLAGKFDSSVYYYSKALVIQTEQENFVGQGYSYHGIGETYLQKGFPDAALDYFNRAYKLTAKSEDVELLSDLYISMGEAYYSLKAFDKSLEYEKMAIEVNEKAGRFPQLSLCFRLISKTYAAQKEFENAYGYFFKYAELMDTLSGIEVGKKLSSLEYKHQIEQDKKITQLENEKTQLKHEAEVKKQRVIIWAGLVILIIVSLFSIFIFRQYKAKKAANFIIRQQKLETEQQKAMLEEKQKEITDSIKYAKRIQQTLMPSEKYIEKNLKHLKKNK